MKAYAQPDALKTLEAALKRRRKEARLRRYHYAVPSLWQSPGGNARVDKVNPFTYYLGAITRLVRIARGKPAPVGGGEWTRDAVIYNMFVRTTTAFDHNGNGAIDLPVNSEGFRETGTFLKAIAMLPYIKRLGANTIHLLPVTSIGQDGNKGTLGSPYAIRNPYELDEHLAEPALGLDVRTEFRAFVEAAHRLGMRVVAEFVFRTAAKDADWVREHPEWFYWIRDTIRPRATHERDEATYGSPLFTPEELGHIHHEVQSHRFNNLIPPHEVYRNFFTPPPDPDAVVREDGRYVGTVADGVTVRIPGAFADWPPDDNQPPWGDVTYLRMYTHPSFNYIAYNTIRMYDEQLAQQQYINTPLWERVVGIIPYYQREFHIDGVMIDMGHALPMALKSRVIAAARSVDSDFAFWDENFSITSHSREEGYNAVFGFLWIDEHHPSRLKAFIKRCAHEGFPIAYFATPENHNTPRAAARPGGIGYAKAIWVVNSFLPAVPFIHSGYELAETYPINTGLDFSNEQLKDLPSERLPLFSAYAYNWKNPAQFTRWIALVSGIRARYRDMIVDPTPQSFRELHTENDHVVAFARVSHDGSRRLAIVCNTDVAHTQKITLNTGTAKRVLVDLLSHKRFTVSHGAITPALSRGQCLVCEF